MTYKNAAAGLELGGGKAVIIGDPHKDKTPDLLRAYGRVVENLDGLYVTAEDVGTSTDDVAIIRETTRHAVGLSIDRGGSGDPSPFTALGVFSGMLAAAKHAWGSEELHGRTVTVQGVGKVGYHLVDYLTDAGCEIVVTDVYQPGARRFDVSEKSSFSNMAGALAALQMLAEWDISRISEILASTNHRIAAILERHGFETTPADIRAPHFQGAHLPATDPRSLAARLIENGVYASVRGEYLRVAPHLYTDEEDLARFDEVLRIALG